MDSIHRNNTHDGLFIAKEGDIEKGYIQYDWLSSDELAIMHTVVDPAYRGQGIAKSLVDAVVVYAQANKKLVKPVCSYAAKVLRGTLD